MKKLIFIILTFLTINPLISQNPYSINGVIIWESEGELFNISPLDTAKIDVNFITLKYKSNTNSATIEAIENVNNLNKYYTSRTGITIYRIDVDNLEYLTLVSNLVSNQNVNDVYFEYLLKYSDGSNDHYYGDMNFDHIHVEDAWNYTTGHPDVIVAVIDNGCNWVHPELGMGDDTYENIFTNSSDPWDNPVEPGSGTVPGDEDENGYDDDYKGWDFYEGDNDVRPPYSQSFFHGTAMSALIAAKTNNNEGSINDEGLVPGIAGGWREEGNVYQGVKILTIRNGYDNEWSTGVTPEAIKYAVDMGARILNFSWGQPGLVAPLIDDAIEYAWEHGAIMFAATGNYSPNGQSVQYPASYEKVVAVGAANDNGDCKWNPSNWGTKTELTGLGNTYIIYEPYNYNYYSVDENTSTSAACATASGAAALLLSYNYDPCLSLSNTEIREILINTAWKSDSEYCPNGPYNYFWDPARPGHSKQLGYGIIDLNAAFIELTTNYMISETQSIEGTVNWDGKKRVDADITINPEATLTITNEVMMFENRKIVIMNGGKLIVDGGIITNACNGRWQGIEVWGDYDAHQYTIDGENAQGQLILKNGAVIENAISAVELWRPGYYNEGEGGIVQATDAIFRNNAKSIHALNYTNFHPHIDPQKETNNVCYFIDCTFEIDEEYIPSHTFYKHIDLDRVNGIGFTACDFTVENVPGVHEKTHGIAAYSAGFSVSAKCANTINPCNEWDKCTFIGFNNGISSTNTLNSYTFYVNRAKFENNTCGIRVGNVNNFIVLSSEFYIGQNTSDKQECEAKAKSAAGYGINATTSTGFAIEENEFYKAEGAPSDIYVGIRIAKTQATDQIYNNYFEGLSYANYTEGKNWYGIETYKGLEFLCNENTNNFADFIVKKGEFPEGGIQSNQGDPVDPAGNGFSPLGATFHILNLGDYNINYYYCGSGALCPNQDPIYCANVFKYGATAVNECPSHYGGVGGHGRMVLDDDDKQEREQQYAQALSDYNNVKALYESLKDGGNTEALKTEVETAWPSDMWELRSELLGKSPHLSMEVLKEAADKTEVLPESVLFEILSANPDELKKEELLKYLEDKENPLPQYMIDILRQVASGITYKTVLQQQMSLSNQLKTRAAHDMIRSILNDTITDLPGLRNWLDNLGGIRADHQIIDTYLAEGNHQDALALAELLPSLYQLEGNELAEHNYYIDMLNLQINLRQQNRNIYELDSTEVINLVSIAENSKGVGGTKAKGILELVYGYEYCDCLNLSDTLGFKSSGIVNPDLFEEMYGYDITAEPNPAKEWIAFNYTLPDNETTGLINISDVSGKLIKTLTIEGEQGQKVWDTRIIKPGVYFYTFKVSGFSKTGKIVISK